MISLQCVRSEFAYRYSNPLLYTSHFSLYTYNRRLQYLDKLNPDRGGEEDSLVEVAICLAAVDKLLGGDEDDNKVWHIPLYII